MCHSLENISGSHNKYSKYENNVSIASRQNMFNCVYQTVSLHLLPLSIAVFRGIITKLKVHFFLV